MKCPYCSTEIAEGSRFCTECGGDISKAQKPAPAPKAAPAAAPQPAPVPPQRPANVQNPQPAAAPVTFAAPAPAPTNPVRPAPSAPAVNTAASAPSAPAYTPSPARTSFDAPAIQFPTTRSVGKYILFSIITLGIYAMVINSRMVTELNITSSRHDGKITMPFFAMSFLTPFTLGIYTFVWMHKYYNRIGENLTARGIDYKFNASTFWIFSFLLSFTIVCPIIFFHKYLKAMNMINEDFNTRG